MPGTSLSSPWRNVECVRSARREPLQRTSHRTRHACRGPSAADRRTQLCRAAQPRCVSAIDRGRAPPKRFPLRYPATFNSMKNRSAHRSSQPARPTKKETADTARRLRPCARLRRRAMGSRKLSRCSTTANGRTDRGGTTATPCPDRAARRPARDSASRARGIRRAAGDTRIAHPARGCWHPAPAGPADVAV